MREITVSFRLIGTHQGHCLGRPYQSVNPFVRPDSPGGAVWPDGCGRLAKGAGIGIAKSPTLFTRLSKAEVPLVYGPTPPYD